MEGTMPLGNAIINDSETTLSISCVDYNVEAFGGADYEFTYIFDRINRKKLMDVLQANGLNGSLSEMIIEKFGEHLELCGVSTFCDQHQIKYETHSRIILD